MLRYRSVAFSGQNCRYCKQIGSNGYFHTVKTIPKSLANLSVMIALCENSACCICNFI